MSGVNIFLLEPKVLFICWSGSNISCDGPEVILTLFRVPLYQDQGTDRDTFADFGKKEGGGEGRGSGVHSGTQRYVFIQTGIPDQYCLDIDEVAARYLAQLPW